MRRLFNNQELRHFEKFDKKLIQFLENRLDEYVQIDFQNKAIERLTGENKDTLAVSQKRFSDIEIDNVINLSKERRALIRSNRNSDSRE